MALFGYRVISDKGPVKCYAFPTRRRWPSCNVWISFVGRALHGPTEAAAEEVCGTYLGVFIGFHLKTKF